MKLSIGCIKDVTELRKALESEKKLNEELALKNEEIIKSNNQLNNTNSQLLMALPFPFSYCKVIVDTNNNPIDYEFMEVNDVFEKHVGIFRKDLIGKLVTQVNPKIPRELIERLGKVGLSGAEISFEQYSPLMQKKYSYKVFSPALGYFCELLIEINNEDKQTPRNSRNWGLQTTSSPRAGRSSNRTGHPRICTLPPSSLPYYLKKCCLYRN